MCECMSMQACAMTYVPGSENSLWESNLSFHGVEMGDETHVFSVDYRGLYSLSHPGVLILWSSSSYVNTGIQLFTPSYLKDAISRVPAVVVMGHSEAFWVTCRHSSLRDHPKVRT